MDIASQGISFKQKNKARFNCNSPYNARSLRKPISVAVLLSFGYLTYSLPPRLVLLQKQLAGLKLKLEHYIVY